MKKKVVTLKATPNTLSQYQPGARAMGIAIGHPEMIEQGYDAGDGHGTAIITSPVISDRILKSGRRHITTKRTIYVVVT